MEKDDLVEKLKERFKISPSESEAISKRIIAFYTDMIEGETNPTAIIIAGQPGSGLSELQKVAMKNLGRNAVECSLEKIKEWYPQVDKIKADYPEYLQAIIAESSQKWYMELRNYCISNKFNFIMPVNLLNGEGVNKTIENIKNNKYICDIYIIAVPAEISKIANMEMNEEYMKAGEGNYPNINDEHDKFIDLMPNALIKIEKESRYDFLYLYGRRMCNINLDDRSGIYQICKTQKSIYVDFMGESRQGLIAKAKNLVLQKMEKVEKMMLDRNAPIEQIEEFERMFGRIIIENDEKNQINKL